ncbi:nitronate monooxygenase [Nocardioides jensenii]|uniref:nitronate monooxygenase n=1 Tax=Nocardioides jensenii TaxID=1843 RepID=UPI001C3F4260|nr:nitronate monooxygenase [Nocardioides jensenii]
MSFLERPNPIIAAPMAGATTPALAAAVSNAGGLGFLAAGYLSVDSMADEVTAYRALTDATVAINLFTPQTDRSLELGPRLDDYQTEVALTAAKYGVSPGDPSFDDDTFDGKVDWLVENPVDVVSFTFGPVPPAAVFRLQEVGTTVGFTVTSEHEALQAVGLGADFLVAQGCEAGGHRGTWHVSDQPNTLSAREVVAAIAGIGLPVIAAGGVGSAADVHALLDAGASAAAVGTLFLACDESKAPAAHKAALTSGSFTSAAVTRAFSGRYARALVNDFVRAHDGRAPSAYPNVHHLTRPIRTAAAAAGDPQGMALWAGSGHAAPGRLTAPEVVARLAMM